MKLIDISRYHVFQFAGSDRLYLLNENYRNKETDECIFEWHRIYRDGRTNLNGRQEYSLVWLNNLEVTDLGDFNEWMKVNHPIRYKREGWENK